ncbi:homoserine kinase [Clostridia bacterium]|nr:homoserine kinase [Clostridia bacterium]
MTGNKYKIKTPATSANIGAGFDCMGLAVDIYNETYAELTDETGVRVETDADLPKNETNLVAATVLHTLKILKADFCGLHIKQINNIPKTSGLGSSAACIVSGVMLGNVLAGGRMSLAAVIDLCNELDGHPDNVLPCITGGVTAGIVDRGHVRYARVVPTGLKVLTLTPDFPLSTALSRKVLPATYSRADAVYNLSHSTLTFGALATGEYSLLKAAADDRIHQPYRKGLIENYSEITAAVRHAGALCVWLSGAGPSIAAFIDGAFDERKLAEAIKPYKKWRYRVCGIDAQGAVIRPINR